MAQLAIKGHPNRGKEVIEILEMLGGINAVEHCGNNANIAYYIKETYKNWIDTGNPNNLDDFIILTIEEFLEKFPYKVGDKVLYKYDNTTYFIRKMFWENDKVLYELSDEVYSDGCSIPDTLIFDVDAVKLQPYKEETMEVSEEFYNKYCIKCGSQRCTAEGEWLEGCRYYKEETMEEIKIEIPEGYEIDKEKSTFENIIFKKKNIVNCWEDIKQINGVWITHLSDIQSYEGVPPYRTNKNVFLNKKYAKSALALAQISQLLPYYDSKVDWNISTPKYCICKYNNNIIINRWDTVYHPIAFNTYKEAERFLKHNEQLVKDYYIMD